MRIIATFSRKPEEQEPDGPVLDDEWPDAPVSRLLILLVMFLGLFQYDPDDGMSDFLMEI